MTQKYKDDKNQSYSMFEDKIVKTSYLFYQKYCKNTHKNVY